MIIVLGIFKSSLFPTKKNVLKSPLFGSSSLKHLRWRFRTCVSCRISVKRYAQNRLWDRARRCTTNGIITFENLHHLLPSIFVFVFIKGVAPSQTVVCLILRIFVCFSPVFRVFFTVATDSTRRSHAEHSFRANKIFSALSSNVHITSTRTTFSPRAPTTPWLWGHWVVGSRRTEVSGAIGRPRRKVVCQ